MRKSISVSLSDELLNQIDEIIDGSNRFSSRSDFLRYSADTVIKQERSIKAIEELNKLLLNISSRSNIELTPEEVESLNVIGKAVSMIGGIE